MKISEGMDWVGKIQDRAVGWAGGVSLGFETELNRCLERAPEKGIPEKTLILNTMLDAYVGSLVMVLYKYGGSGKQQEDALIAGVQAKFRSLREANMGAEHEMGEVKYDPEDDNKKLEAKWKGNLPKPTTEN